MSYLNTSGSRAICSRALIGDMIIPYTSNNPIKVSSLVFPPSTVLSVGIAGDVTGNLIGDVTGGLTGNVIGNITGDVIGGLTGNVIGNLTGDVTGDVIGGLTGDVTGDVIGGLTGNVIGNLTGDVTGDVIGGLTGNVIGNITGDVTGDVIGGLTGNVIGGLTGNVIGNITGDVTGDVIGGLTGNVIGNLTGDVIGGLTGNVIGNLTGDVIAGDISTINFTVINEASISKLGSTIDANGRTLTNLPVTPSLPTDAASKQYVDSVAVGISWKENVLLGTTADLNATYTGAIAFTLESDIFEVLIIDDVATEVGNRILVKNQTTATENGIYVVTDIGSESRDWILTRADDYNSSGEIKPGDAVFVLDGTENYHRSYTMYNSSFGTIDIDDILFTIFSSTVTDLTTKGDLLGYSTGESRFPVGANGSVLIADSTEAFGIKWGTQSEIDHGLLSGLSDDDHTQYVTLNGRVGDYVAINTVYSYPSVGLGVTVDGVVITNENTANTFKLSSGTSSIAVTSESDLIMDQDVSTTGTPTFAEINTSIIQHPGGGGVTLNDDVIIDSEIIPQLTIKNADTVYTSLTCTNDGQFIILPVVPGDDTHIVLSSNTTIEGALTLPTTTGIPTPLDYYEEYALTLSVTGAWTANVEARFIRIGSAVNFYFEESIHICTAISKLSANGVIPTRFLPNEESVFAVIVVVDPSSSDNIGSMVMRNNGNMSWYGINGLVFSSIGFAVGFFSGSTSYFVA